MRSLTGVRFLILALVSVGPQGCSSKSHPAFIDYETPNGGRVDGPGRTTADGGGSGADDGQGNVGGAKGDAGGTRGNVAGASHAAAGAGGAASESVGTFGSQSRLLNHAPWQVGQETTGMAIDDAGQIYISDPDNIYIVRDGKVDVYLSTDDLKTTFGFLPGGDFEDLDIGPDQQLTIAFSRSLLRSSKPHEAVIWRDLSAKEQPIGDHIQLGVIDDDRVGLMTDKGFAVVSTDQSEKLYDPELVMWEQGCAGEDLAMTRSGVFLYQPGCTLFPIFRGKADGSELGLLYYAEEQDVTNPMRAGSFNCSGRDPAGGFLVVTSSSDAQFKAEPRLYHLDEDSNASSGVVLMKSLKGAYEIAVKDDLSAFGYCSVAGGLDGSVYVQTFSQLWRFAP